MSQIRLPFTSVQSALGEAAWMPYLPISLKLNLKTTVANGLLDTGSTVNVLPYSLGLELGADWEKQSNPLLLAGNLANFEAKALILDSQVADFKPVRLVFAWTKSNQVPLILGQTNFFMEFNVCFYRANFSFEIRPKSS